MSIFGFLGNIFNLFLLQPIINLVALILYVLNTINIPGAVGFSIIILTVITTLVIWPFKSKQLRSMKEMNEKMALIKPKLNELKIKHKDDKQAFYQAQAALYKEHNVNPAAGCLPSLLPILVILPLYQVIFAFFEGDKGLEKINYFLYNEAWRFNSIPDLNFFGLNLATKPSDFAISGFLLVPVITALLTLVQSLMMAPRRVKHYKTDSARELKEKEKNEDAQETMQKQMVYMMPIMIGYFAFTFPVGVAIFWNTNTILGIVQQYTLTGWGGMEDFKKSLESRVKSLDRKKTSS